MVNFGASRQTMGLSGKPLNLNFSLPTSFPICPDRSTAILKKYQDQADLQGDSVSKEFARDLVKELAYLIVDADLRKALLEDPMTCVTMLFNQGELRGKNKGLNKKQLKQLMDNLETMNSSWTTTVKPMFEKADVDRSGKVDFEELKKLMAEIRVPPTNWDMNQLAAELMDKVDGSGDGEISKLECFYLQSEYLALIAEKSREEDGLSWDDDSSSSDNGSNGSLAPPKKAFDARVTPCNDDNSSDCIITPRGRKVVVCSSKISPTDFE